MKVYNLVRFSAAIGLSAFEFAKFKAQLSNLLVSNNLSITTFVSVSFISMLNADLNPCKKGSKHRSPNTNAGNELTSTIL